MARLASTALALALAGACSAEDYSARADRSALRLLEEREDSVLGTREERAQRPVELPPPAAPAPGEAEQALPGEPTPEPGAEGEPVKDNAAAEPAAAHVVDLRAALAIAYRSSRQMIDRRETLHLQALSLAGVRHDFAPQLSLALSYEFDESRGNPDKNSGDAAFTATQILPTGAQLTINAGSTANGAEGFSPGYSSGLSVNLTQPLLRGGGYALTHEPLIQAERNLVYAIREFELFREDFSIDVARRYYDLVNRKESIKNQLANLDSNVFGRKQAEALFAVGRAKELDVLRARRSELTARNALLEAQESLHLALDNFRIFLGLPESEPIDVEKGAPTFVPVNYTLASAMDVAQANRLDLLNRHEQLEDQERGLRLARNSLLPDLGLTLGTSYGTDGSGGLGGNDLQRNDLSLGVSFGVPLDRVREQNAYRSTEIGLARARRDLEEFEDQLKVSIQSSFRELARRLQSLDIQRQLIEDQTKNVRIAELRFERGELPNRDVVEANQSLLDAQNSLIDEQVNYEIARLQLLRDLGILFIDETGMWK